MPTTLQEVKLDEIRAPARIMPSAYRPELDILRFCSFFAVFCVHTLVYPVESLTSHYIPFFLAKAYFSLVSAGGFGVDLFFLLSAYLITDLLLREKRHFGSLHIKAFYIRRLLRIWPLYFVFVALVVLIPFLDIDHGKEFTAKYAAAFFLFCGNWAFTIWGWPTSVLVPLWSVSIEEQFYLLWPPIVARLTPQWIIWAASGVIVFANIYRAIEIALYHHSPMMMWGNTFAHLDSLAAGIAVAAILRGRIPQFRLGTRVAMAGLALFLFGLRAAVNADANSPQRLSAIGQYPLIPIACCLMLLAFLGLQWRAGVLEYLGKISYGLYAYHVFMLYLTSRLTEGLGHGALHTVARVAGTLGLTMLVSVLSYELMEKPFLRLKDKFTWVASRPA